MRYETVEDALKMLNKLSGVTISDAKEITHAGNLTLRACGAVDYLRKQHGYAVSNPKKCENWNISSK